LNAKLSKHAVGGILRDYESGSLISQLAAKHHVSEAAIAYHLHKYGVKTRRKGWQRGKRKVERPVQIVAPQFVNVCALADVRKLGFWQRVKVLFAA
jgi:hypothetical protein